MLVWCNPRCDQEALRPCAVWSHLRRRPNFPGADPKMTAQGLILQQHLREQSALVGFADGRCSVLHVQLRIDVQQVRFDSRLRGRFITLRMG
jgi:hypothetical protein